MRGINVSFSNRALYTLIAAAVIIIVGIGVYAYGTSNPAVFGHSADEIEEIDPTVPDSVKDGVDWSEITGIPAGFADGIDDAGGDNLGNHIATQDIDLNGNSIKGAAWVGHKWVPDGTVISCDLFGGESSDGVTGYARVNNGKIETKMAPNSVVWCRNPDVTVWQNKAFLFCDDIRHRCGGNGTITLSEGVLKFSLECSKGEWPKTSFCIAEWP